VWAAGGRLLATYEGPGEPHPNTYHFHLTDWLGTQRMQTIAAGNNEEACYSYPFGDGLTCTGTDATENHFTGKERDAESGLDYFKARYFSSDLGRFMTADWAAKPTAVPYADFGNPQSLDLFVYALNNPLEKDDIDGHDWRDFAQKFEKWTADHPRTWSAIKAGGAAVVTAAAVAAVVATAPVTVPATLVGAAVTGLVIASETIAATGAAVATVTYTVAAITGDKKTDQAAGVIQTVTDPAGYVTTVATGGNTDAGGVAADVNSLLAVDHDPVAATLGAVDLSGNMLSAASSDAGQDQTEQPPADPDDPDPVLPTTPPPAPEQDQQQQSQTPQL
jgi:RHS repeat-associated protein